MATLAAILVTSLTLVHSAPTVNTTSHSPSLSGNAEPSFVTEPKGRGTVGLLTSCVITLTLCVWTAIHLNIIRSPTLARRLGFKTLYVLLGLFAPEIILATAYSEWKDAKRISKAAQLAGAASWAIAAAEQLDSPVPAPPVDNEATGEVCEPPTAGNETHGRQDEAAGMLGREEGTPFMAEGSQDEASSSGGALAKPLDEPLVGSVVSNRLREAAQLVDRAMAAAWDIQNKCDEAQNRLVLAEKRRDDAKRRPNDAQKKLDVQISMMRSAGEQRLGDQQWWEQQEELLAVLKADIEDRRTEVRETMAEAVAAAPRAAQACGEAVTAWMDVEFKQRAALNVTKLALSANTKSNKNNTFWTRWWASPEPGYTVQQPTFGIESSFFAVMGGYTLSPNERYSDHTYAHTLTTDGFIFLLRSGLITTDALVNLKGETADKGKADMVAKFLVCVQALWMMVNCLCRKISGLPVTLIELNVVVHVLCAVSIYGFWLMKPHDAGLAISLTPTFLDDQLASLICTKGKHGRSLMASRDVPGALPESYEFNPTNPVVDNRVVNNAPKITANLHLGKHREHTKPLDQELINNATRPDGLVMVSGSQVLVDNESGYIFRPNGGAVHLTQRDLTLFMEAAKELRNPRFPHLKCHDGTADDGPDGACYTLFTPSASITSSTNQFLRVADIFWVVVPLGLVHGAVHATAWNSHFPTALEQRLWKASCIIIAAPSFILVVVAVCGSLGVVILSICYSQPFTKSFQSEVFLKVLDPVAKSLESGFRISFHHDQSHGSCNPFWDHCLIRNRAQAYHREICGICLSDGYRPRISGFYWVVLCGKNVFGC